MPAPAGDPKAAVKAKLQTKKVADLRKALISLNMDSTGKKAELVARLATVMTAK